MASPKKSIAMIALGKPPPPPEGEEEGSDEPGGLEMAMEDFLSALEAKDTQGMATAFRNAAEICDTGDDYGAP